MRLLRVRLTLRTMMIVVALVGSGLAYLTHRRSQAFRLIALANAQEAELYAAKVQRLGIVWRMSDDGAKRARELADRHGMLEEEAERIEKKADEEKQQLEVREKELAYYKMLDEKYRRAAAQPWLRVDPDPPPPQAGIPASPIGSVSSSTRRENKSAALTLVVSLPRKVFKLSEHPVFKGTIPLTIEFRNNSAQPITIYPIGRIMVADEEGKEPELTAQGSQYRRASSPGYTRRKHSSVVVRPGESYRDIGLQLNSLYRLPPGRYTLRMSYDDDALNAVSPTVDFEVIRAESSG